jgi:hypothetical protein
MRFHKKDLGKLRYVLRIEVAKSRTGINLSQRKYVIDLLEETGELGEGLQTSFKVVITLPPSQ